MVRLDGRLAPKPLIVAMVGPSARYEDLAAGFRPVFARIRETVVARDRARRLPHDAIGWLKQSGFTPLRPSEAEGGFSANLPGLFALLTELSQADPTIDLDVRAGLIPKVCAPRADAIFDTGLSQPAAIR